MLPAVFVVTEADAAAIRTAYEQEGELSAAIEMRRLFPGITDAPGPSPAVEAQLGIVIISRCRPTAAQPRRLTGD